MLELSSEQMRTMRNAEKEIVSEYMKEFLQRQEQFGILCGNGSVEEFYRRRIEESARTTPELSEGERRIASSIAFADRIGNLPADRIPVVVAGGSFNNASHHTVLREEECRLLDDLLEKAEPEKVFFVIGTTLSGYEKYLWEKAKDRFEVFAFVPAEITAREKDRILSTGIPVRIALESSVLGSYKSFAFEIFKRRQSVILALDGNSAASNLIQDAKNSKYKSRTFINPRSRYLRSKAESLQGYMTLLRKEGSAEEILSYVNEYYEALKDPNAQILKKPKRNPNI